MYNAKEESIEGEDFKCENCGRWCMLADLVTLCDGETRCITCHNFLGHEIRSAKQYRLDI
jgi:hypothetical protein